MGRLVGIELHNFKSYLGTTRVGFGTSHFTSIIGPNGAGKSNMMDAISFVLGVKSSHLRSQNLKDLIYRGSIMADQRSTLEASEDPDRAYVMAIYEKDDGQTLYLKRTITSTGNSEYKINDKTVTALNYNMILKSENILIKARNFLVFQGDVEQIASQSPKELTSLIETISGSAEYAREYDEARDEYEKAREFSSSVFSRKRTLNSESKQYKVQLEEQREFEEKLMEKADIIKKINLYKLYHNELKHYSIKQDIENKQSELKAIQAQLDKETKEYDEKMAEYSKISLKEKKDSENYKKISKELEVCKRELIPLDANRKATVNKINSQKKKLEFINKDIEAQKNEVLQVERQLRDAERLFREFQNKVRSNTSSVSEEAQQEYENLRAEYLAQGGSAVEEELSLLYNEKESIDSIINNLNSQKHTSGNRISELEHCIESELLPRLHDIDAEIKDLLEVKQSKIDARASLIKLKDQFNFRELNLNSELRDTLVRLDELSSEQRESNKQKRLRENVSMLKKLFPKNSIKGVMYDLVRPTKQMYEDALLTLLGKNFDAVVVETTSVAYKCIEVLKERRAGVVTFIPLDSILNDSIKLNYLRSIHSGSQPGIDIVEYDDKSLEPAINYVIGDALVVDSLDTARLLKWDSQYKLNNKLVTVDGSIINRSGLMTGGKQQKKSTVILNWDKKEWNRLNDLKDELQSKLKSINEERPKELEINLLAQEMSEIDDKLPLLRSQQQSVNRIIEDKRSEISHMKSTIEEYNEKAKNRNESLILVNERINTLENSAKEIKNNIYNDFCEKFGYEDGIEVFEDLYGSSLRVKAKERTQFSKAVSVLTNKLKFEKERLEDIEKREINLKKNIGDFEADYYTIDKDRNSLNEKIDKLEASLEISLEVKEMNEKKLSDNLKSARILESKQSEFQTKLGDIQKELAAFEQFLLRVDVERVNILKNCKIESINIPLKDGLLETISINEDTDSLLNEIYSIEIDYYLLDGRLRESYNSKTEAELEVQLQNIIEDLEKLTPNSKAVERLKEVELKLKEFDKDHTKARQRERNLYEKFQVIRDKRFLHFMKAFDHISGQIDVIYKELTKSNASPLGGSAYLTLEDEENPFLSGIKYHAMPPLKRFRDIDFLSGGEKTIAALALLFTIHSFQPSPFFVLDEVDAALDNSNVSKIANYIRKNAGPNFQVIVISLKNSLFEKSDALVGIYREHQENCSKTVSLDLREYPEEETPLISS